MMQSALAAQQPDGMWRAGLPVGDAPLGFDPEHTEPFGIGAFLLAGSEVHRLFTREQ